MPRATRFTLLLAVILLPALLLGCRNRQTAGFETGPDEPATQAPGRLDRPFGPADPAPAANDAVFVEDDPAMGRDAPVTDEAPPPEVTFSETPPNFAPAGGGITHVIRKGDTLWSLARQYYGDPRRWTDIRDANPGLNPNAMRVGQQIVIP